MHEEKGKQTLTVSKQPPCLQLHYTCCCTPHWSCKCLKRSAVGFCHIDDLSGLGKEMLSRIMTGPSGQFSASQPCGSGALLLQRPSIMADAVIPLASMLRSTDPEYAALHHVAMHHEGVALGSPRHILRFRHLVPLHTSTALQILQGHNTSRTAGGRESTLGSAAPRRRPLYVETHFRKSV